MSLKLAHLGRGGQSTLSPLLEVWLPRPWPAAAERSALLRSGITTLAQLTREHDLKWLSATTILVSVHTRPSNGLR
jgi:hypothetical protein